MTDELFWLLSAQVYSIKSRIKNSYLALDCSRQPFVHFLNMNKLCVVFFNLSIKRKQQSNTRRWEHHAATCGWGFPGCARYINAGRREGGREGRKEARRGTGMGSISCVEMSQSAEFSTQTIVHLHLAGPKWENWTRRASISLLSSAGWEHVYSKHAVTGSDIEL